MKVSENLLFQPNYFNCVNLEDKSIMFVKYRRINYSKYNYTMKESTHQYRENEKEFKLEITLPETKDLVDELIIITHTSTSCFMVVRVSTAVEQKSFKNYNEINSYLKKIYLY